MTNQKNKTIDVKDLPLTERLSAARKLANGETAEFLGRVVVNEPISAAAKADALAAMPASFRLAQARTGKATTPKIEPVQPLPTGSLVTDENGVISGFAFDSDGE